MKQELSINHAITLFNSNKQQAGIKVIEEILNLEPNNVTAHQVMVKAGFQQKNHVLAEKHLLALIKIQPSTDSYFQPLIELYGFQKRWCDLANIYKELAAKHPTNANHQFNCGYYLKLCGKFSQAIKYYKQALSLNINDAYEVYLNIAIIYSEHLSAPQKAIDLLLIAIEKYPNQDSLKYNLANVYEQLGDKKSAFSMFQSAFSQNPKNFDALARQADIYKINSKEDEIVKTMKDIFSDNNIEKKDKVNIAYALGKAHDDCKDYELAASFYQKANELDQVYLPRYEPEKFEQYIDNIINTFNQDWFKATSQLSNQTPKESPIFICGMFRSGSTLCEQIIASHSKVNSGGEQEFFHRSILSDFPDFPLDVPEKFASNRDKLLTDYLNEVKEFKSGGDLLTDKRPDNFLYLGLIKTLMPNAKIIWTKRFIFDNCLSVFFLRLGSSMSYATKIENTLHFYKQQEKLMNHWLSLFGDDILAFNYDELISEPEVNIRELISFFDLSWEESCLNFHQANNQVKTASVWQVRQPLYKGSSGRWKNYQQYFSFDY
ncbi:sulfotransferase [Colwellia sp. 1_MG-2023]|uniref:tetratricopeptide repeat-containing sulfotransferase family protein n=1 Tax=Colwellia sp. 1_MG-2023 TaxID=3062649 RepID=UPI0026E3A4D4|nr:tetratricopeptide repeat-containing sulfotransferase family protein [Colwellia sp. 1_MG-2023]MDO6445719.1 sulfotransferase [Colwellia sp. 1_MG-2023]